MMKMDKTKNDLDCVKMKREIQEQIYKETKGMTPEEYLAYTHKRIANSQFSWFLERKKVKKSSVLLAK